MNASMQAELDFSIFILQFNFFNKLASLARHNFAKTTSFTSLLAFSSAKFFGLVRLLPFTLLLSFPLSSDRFISKKP